MIQWLDEYGDPLCGDVEMESISWFERKGVLDHTRHLLAERSCEGYIVGGYVRDLLLARPTRDLDLVVKGEALAVAREAADVLGGAFVLLDKERHTARVVVRDVGVRYYLDFATLQGKTLYTDLGARDFTINAMALDVQDNAREPCIIDPFDGRRDLESRTVRAVSDAVFQDDAIRLLRAVRFAAELDLEVELQTEQLMERDASLIGQVSAERVRDELCKILDTGRSEARLRYMDRVHLLGHVLPELEPLRVLRQPLPHDQDALEHSLGAVGGVDRVLEALRSLSQGETPWAPESGGAGRLVEDQIARAVGPFAPQLAAYVGEELAGERGRSVLLKLSALLHETGTASTARVDEKGWMGSLGHYAQGAAAAARALRRLRFGNREVKLVRTTIQHHMRPLELSELEEISDRAVHRFFRDTGGAGIDVLLLSLADHLDLVQYGADVDQWERICDAVGVLLQSYYERYEEIIEPVPLLSGRDLVEGLGMEPGPEVGRVLLMLYEAQAAGEVSSREEALQLASNLRQEPGE
jgi:tRNA nucleotidyltransferase/poly(A) polymerase